MENLEQNEVIKTKLFHPILVLLCSLIVVPLFLYFSFLTLQSWFAGKTDSVAGISFILVSTLGLLVWSFSALRSVLLKPKIIIYSEGVYLDVSRRSRSWGVIPWGDIIGITAVPNPRIDYYLFIYLSPQSQLYSRARKNRSSGGSFLRVSTKYIGRASNIAGVLAEKGGLQHSQVPLTVLYGKTKSE